MLYLKVKPHLIDQDLAPVDKVIITSVGLA